MRRFPYHSALRRTLKYASLLMIAGALPLNVFEQSENMIRTKRKKEYLDK
jgi:hypothetical protein